jgi:hypothetical protein
MDVNLHPSERIPAGISGRGTGKLHLSPRKLQKFPRRKFGTGNGEANFVLVIGLYILK